MRRPSRRPTAVSGRPGSTSPVWEPSSTSTTRLCPDRCRDVRDGGATVPVVPVEVPVHRILPALALPLVVAVAGLAAAPPPARAAPTCGGKPATMVFGDGDDVVTGTPGDDVVVLG